MSLSRKLLAWVLALAAFLSLFTAKAQNLGFVSATVTPTAAAFNSPITFSIIVTNATASQQNTIYVTNFFSSFASSNSASMVNSASNNLFGQIISDNSQFVFRFDNLIAGDIARLTFTVTPLNVGSFTNQVVLSTPFVSSIATTSAVASITPPSADLAVGMTSTASGVLVNDQTVIGLSVTNLGPISATGVVLSNTLPTSFELLSISPTNSHTLTNGSLVLALGTLTNGATRHFHVTVQPTNAVTNFNLIASIFSPNVEDTNTANSVVTNVISVSDILSTNLTVTELSQQFNPQTGLREMQVQLSNVGTNDVPAARVIVSGLTNGTRLYNAVGTNSGNAYVLYNNTLTNGTSVNLLLEFYVLDRGPLTNRTLSAIGVPALNLNTPTTSGVVITNPVMSSGGFLIEFGATPGKTYTIVYAGDTSFSNAFTAQPSIVAPANRVQWIDNGPPKTISHPLNTTSRVYRVFQSQ